MPRHIQSESGFVREPLYHAGGETFGYVIYRASDAKFKRAKENRDTPAAHPKLLLKLETKAH